MSNHPPLLLIMHHSCQLYFDYSLHITAVTKNTENIVHTIISPSNKFTVRRRGNCGQNVFIAKNLQLIMSSEFAHRINCFYQNLKIGCFMQLFTFATFHIALNFDSHLTRTAGETDNTYTKTQLN